jgi:hypothetical protein
VSPTVILRPLYIEQPGSDSVTSKVREKKGDVSDRFETPPSLLRIACLGVT